jgi:hypothetical protein
MLATGQQAPTALTIDATNLYWINFGSDDVYSTSGSIMRLPLRGGTPVTVASQQRSPRSLIVAGSTLYWTNGGTDGDGTGSSVMKVDISGGSATMIVDATQGSPAGIAATSTSLYWATYSSSMGGRILMTPLAGGGLTEILPGIFGDILIDGPYLFAASNGTPGDLIKVELTGASPATLAMNQESPHALAIDDTSIYWTTQGLGSGMGTVLKMPKNGGVLSALATGQDEPHGLAVDASGVYWTTSYVNGTIMALPHAGGPPRIIASGATPWGLALDAGAIYWVDAGDGTVMKLAKP